MYCSIDDVRGRNSLLLASSNNASDARIEEAVNYADSIIDGSLSDRYTVPLVSVPAIVRGISADLAASELLSQIIGTRGDNDEPTQAQDLRKKAMDLLDRIASGKIDLQINSASVVQNATIQSTTYGKRRKFDNWDPSRPWRNWRHV